MLSHYTEYTRNYIQRQIKMLQCKKSVKIWNRVEMILLKWDKGKLHKISSSLCFWYFLLPRTLKLWKFFAVLKNGKCHTFISMWNMILCLFIMIYILCTGVADMCFFGSLSWLSILLSSELYLYLLCLPFQIHLGANSFKSRRNRESYSMSSSSPN